MTPRCQQLGKWTVIGLILHGICRDATGLCISGIPRKPIRINIQIPRYNFHDALAEIVKQTGIEVVSDSYAKPRPKVAAANLAGKPFRLQAPSVEKALDQLCAVFGYQWTKDGNVYLLRNQYPHLDEPYQVSAAGRKRVDALPPILTFKHLTQFLNLKQEWIESLSEQRPQFIMLSKKSPRRAEIVFYARLPAALRARLDRGEKVACSEIPRDIRVEIQKAAKARWKGITTGQVTKFVYRLTTDPQGWQRLQTLNLPAKLPPPKKAR